MKTGSAKHNPRDYFKPAEKEAIVSFLCDKEKPEGHVEDKLGGGGRVVEGPYGLENKSAIASLAKLAKESEKSVECNAIHRAIESSDFDISEDVIRKLRDNPPPGGLQSKTARTCLEMCDEQGRTYMHMALMQPFTEPCVDRKIRWARMLAEIEPRLLEKDTCGGKTPLQYLHEQIELQKESTKGSGPELLELGNTDPKLQKLETDLKRLCLLKFDNRTCKDIMYKKNDGKY